jgi:hypothetical protein
VGSIPPLTDQGRGEDFRKARPGEPFLPRNQMGQASASRAQAVPAAANNCYVNATGIRGQPLFGGALSLLPFRPREVHAVPGHTRAWLKIQEGCSHQCRYCIVPQVRGPRRSLDPAAVLTAFQDLAGLGYQEVVLTGVDLGQYGLDHASREPRRPGAASGNGLSPSGFGFPPWSP